MSASAQPATRLVDQVLHEAANRFGVTAQDVLGPERYQPMINARQVSCYLLVERLGMSFASIGRLMSRDHTTIMHAHRQVTEKHARREVLRVARELDEKLFHPPVGQAAKPMMSIVPPEAAEPEASELISGIMHDFAYHPPSSPKIAAGHQQVRDLLMRTAVDLTGLVPAGRDLDRALEAIETAMHWANAGIAKQQQLGPRAQIHTA